MFMSFNAFSCVVLRNFIYKIKAYINVDTFVTSISIKMLLFFYYLTAMAKNFSTISNKSGENALSFPIVDLNGETVRILLLSMNASFGIFCICLYQDEEFLLSSCLLCVFIMK